MIVIQHIQTQWSKLSRGMPAAQLRQAIASAFALPDIGIPQRQDTIILLHQLNACEHDNFSLKQQVSYLNTSSYWTFNFQQNNDGIAVYFKEDNYYHGQPHHAGYSHLLGCLKQNEIATLKINGRFAGKEGYLYKQHMINLACVQQVDADIFIRRKPMIVIDKTVDLF